MSAQHWSLRLVMATVALAGFAAVFNARAQQDEKPHSTQFSGGAPTPFVIPLQSCSHTPILGHHL